MDKVQTFWLSNLFLTPLSKTELNTDSDWILLIAFGNIGRSECSEYLFYLSDGDEDGLSPFSNVKFEYF